MKRQQGGFTLIELVVVITILGILAAFAIPRFISLETQARVAAVEALGGSVNSGAALAHAMWLASGGGATVAMDGATVTVNAEGYPTPDAAGIAATLTDMSGFTAAYGTDAVFTKTGAPATCTVTYSVDAGTGVPSVAVSPTC